MSKIYLVSNPSFIQRSHKRLTLKPYAKDVEVTKEQFADLKATYPNILKYRVAEAKAKPTQQDPVQEPGDSVKTIELVADLGLSSNVQKALLAAGVEKIEQLTAMTAADVIAVKGIADAGLAEVVEALKSHELTLKEGE
jgi:DNA-directed RNA polymerase alpha subunit